MTITEVRVTTLDGKNVTIAVEYESGAALVILKHQRSALSPLEPAATKVEVANQLTQLGTALAKIEPDQIIIEWQVPSRD